MDAIVKSLVMILFPLSKPGLNGMPPFDTYTVVTIVSIVGGFNPF